MGGIRLIEYLQCVYGPLEGCMAYYMAYSIDYKLLNRKQWKAAVELSGLT